MAVLRQSIEAVEERGRSGSPELPGGPPYGYPASPRDMPRQAAAMQANRVASRCVPGRGGGPGGALCASLTRRGAWEAGGVGGLKARTRGRQQGAACLSLTQPGTLVGRRLPRQRALRCLSPGGVASAWPSPWRGACARRRRLATRRREDLVVDLDVWGASGLPTAVSTCTVACAKGEARPPRRNPGAPPLRAAGVTYSAAACAPHWGGASRARSAKRSSFRSTDERASLWPPRVVPLSTCAL